MPEREKIIKGLETCSQKTVLYVCGQCPYNNDDDDTYDCTQALAEGALAMLKEQQEIVRCKDCANWDKSTMKHYEDVLSGSGDTAECRMFCDMDSWGEFTDDMRRTDGNWFCADGKRRKAHGEVTKMRRKD